MRTHSKLPFPQSPWKCLLVGKLIESCSRIKHKIRICILSNSVVDQTPYKFAAIHSSRDCCRTNTLTLSFLRSLIRSRFGFNFHATRRPKKRAVRENTSSLPLLLSPFKYGYSFMRLKRPIALVFHNPDKKYLSTGSCI